MPSAPSGGGPRSGNVVIYRQDATTNCPAIVTQVNTNGAVSLTTCPPESQGNVLHDHSEKNVLHHHSEKTCCMTIPRGNRAASITRLICDCLSRPGGSARRGILDFSCQAAYLEVEQPDSRPGCPDARHNDFARLLQIMAPGTDDLVAVFESYFDESGSHDGSPVLCVAGYLYDPNGCLELDREWKAVLDEYELPFFRMCACAHGNPPFDHLSLEQRIDCQTKIIKIIRRHMRMGFAVTVPEREYYQWQNPDYPLGTAYTWCCYMCLIAIKQWMQRANFQGEMSYFFEAGHQHRNEADAVMGSVLELPEFRYRSHGFVKKADVRPVQSADALAWQAGTFRKRLMLEGNAKPRADFRALVNERTSTLHGTKQMFDRVFHGFSALLRGESIEAVLAS
jgi:hypothetical protein